MLGKIQTPQRFIVFFNLTLCLVAMFVGIAAAQDAGAQEAASKKSFKFDPVRGEDWPETGETDGGSAGDDSDNGRAPASEGDMPNMKYNPDGTIDPDSFKGMF